jgi:murein L,D-transpeptidase YcbB/YkuD
MTRSSTLNTGWNRTNHRRLRLQYFLGLLLVLVAGCERGLGKPAEAVPNIQGGKASADSGHQRLTGEGTTALYALLDAAELPDLRPPKSSNFRTELKEFYDSFENTLPWVQGSRPTPQARAIIKLLESAETKGLRPQDYDGPGWDERIAGLEQPSPALEPDLIRFDVAVTVSTMKYVLDLHIGRINPRLYHFGLDINRQDFDLSEFLRRELVEARDINAVIETVEPPFPAYRQTRIALNRYLQLARQDDGELLPVPAKAIKPGDSYAGVPRLIRLLHLLGDLREQDQISSPEMVYEGNLVDAVKHFQQRHGIEPNGQIDVPTVRQLNTPLGRRVVQLELTLERWRWLPHQFERPPIVVDIPAFRLYAANEKYQVALSMKVVVGRAYQHKTPVFTSKIKSVLFRPYWNVPLVIQQHEIVPHLEKDSSYLLENSYEIVDSHGDLVSEGAVNDEIMEKLRSGQLAIRQRPGPDNALGFVKFEFPNRYDVYMHDTPAKGLFSRSRRDFSHGCIRVEDAAALASWALRDEPEWTPENIRAAMNGEETIRVDIKKPIPVLILYGTAVVLENSEVEFYNDIYGYDAALERALAVGYPHSK